MLRWWGFSLKEWFRTKIRKIKFFFKDSLQDQSIVLILISSGLKTMIVQDNPDFTKRFFQINIKGQAGLIYPLFTVPIGNSKNKVKISTLLKLHWWYIIIMLKIVVSLVVYNKHSLRQYKIMPQDLLRFKWRNCYIVNLRVIVIVLYFLMLLWKTNWITLMRSVSIGKILNGKTRQFLHSSWHQLKWYLVTVNGQCW